MHYTAELIAVGTELLLGNIANTDAQILSQGLSTLVEEALGQGINTYSAARLRTLAQENETAARKLLEEPV